jgi:enamine deaminase RidA (YjgF/YER057c/UK114 family)
MAGDDDVGVANQTHNPPDVFAPYANYAHAIEVRAGARTLYISGLNGFERDGTTMPAGFEEQATLVWQHLARVLASAGMTYDDLVALRFYLADPAFDAANVALLMRHLGDHRAARTVVCARLLEPRWLIEVEAIAAV